MPVHSNIRLLEFQISEVIEEERPDQCDDDRANSHIIPDFLKQIPGKGHGHEVHNRLQWKEIHNLREIIIDILSYDQLDQVRI